jgi:hypothetical protein
VGKNGEVPVKGSVFKRCKEHGVTGVEKRPACKIDHGSWFYVHDVTGPGGAGSVKFSV